MPSVVLQAVVNALEARESIALITVTDAEGDLAPAIGRHCAIWADADRPIVGDLQLGALTETVLQDARAALDRRRHEKLAYTTDTGAARLFVDVQAQAPHLIIVGAGHIAVPLAAIAAINDFDVTVLDDRPQYAHPARFPSADQVIAGDFRGELQELRRRGRLDNHTYIVLVTRGHQYDVDSLLEVLDDPLAYVGMIGSRRRIRAVFDLLESEKGIDPARFTGIYAPIGIDIGAQTPAEIAVCIMAEIINLRRGGPATPLSDQILAERQSRRQRGSLSGG